MSRLLLLAALVYLLLLAGLATLSGRLLVLAVPLVVYLAAALLYGPEEVRLRVSRTVGPDRIAEGAPATVRLLIVNEGENLEQVLIEDQFPSTLEVLDGEPRVLTALQAGASVAVEYSVAAKRGLYNLGEVRATASDCLGLAIRRAVLSAPAQIHALPSVLPLRRLAIRPIRTRSTAGQVPARLGGSGVEFYGVREYQPGDPRRWINWRISARHSAALFTTEFRQERIADVGLILDARWRSDVRVGDDCLFNHAVRATAALADAFLRDGNRVGLLVYGQYLAWTFPGYGKVQRERILHALARAEQGDSLVFDNLEYLPTRFFPAQSQLVLVSPVDRDDVPVLVRLRARGYQLLVIRPDRVAFELKDLAGQPAVEQAARIVNVERVLVRRSLVQAGIQVVDWPVDQPFDRTIHAALGRVPLWTRALKLE